MIQAVHPVLGARDVRASIAFFQRLGFALTFTDTDTGAAAAPSYAAVQRDQCELHLQWQGPDPGGDTHDRPTYRFLVADVDRLFAEFRAAGVVPAARAVAAPAAASPFAQPADSPWGTREFHLRDPAGNGLQFYRPL